jgi:hypothetical protein
LRQRGIRQRPEQGRGGDSLEEFVHLLAFACEVTKLQGGDSSLRPVIGIQVATRL